MKIVLFFCVTCLISCSKTQQKEQQKSQQEMFASVQKEFESDKQYLWIIIQKYERGKICITTTTVPLKLQTKVGDSTMLFVDEENNVNVEKEYLDDIFKTDTPTVTTHVYRIDPFEKSLKNSVFQREIKFHTVLGISQDHKKEHWTQQ